MRGYGGLRRMRKPGILLPAAMMIAPTVAVLALAMADPGISGEVIAVLALCAALLATAGIAAFLAADAALLEAAGKQLSDYLNHRKLPPTAGDDSSDRLLRDVATLCARLEHQRSGWEGLALQDPLTGINNRRGAEVLLARARALPETRLGPVSIAVVDVDDLHELNAVGGHARGDAGLRRLAQELQDVLGDDEWVARWGGDEFLVLCRRKSPEMVMVMEQIRRTLGLNSSQGGGDELSVSIGVAQLSTQESLHECIVRADEALFAAKSQGRDTVRSAA